jgi:hypothetical protein
MMRKRLTALCCKRKLSCHVTDCECANCLGQALGLQKPLVRTPAKQQQR